MKFGQRPCTIVQGLWPDFGATLKIRKKSKFDWNQLKLSTQHQYMYMYQKTKQEFSLSPSYLSTSYSNLRPSIDMNSTVCLSTN